jgi:L-lactate dehydrogenase complex protein LldG
MADARETVLASLRARLSPGRDETLARDAVRARLGGHRRGTVPARSKGDRASVIELFARKAQAAEATVVFIDGDADIPDEVARYLAQENLPARLKLAPDERLAGIDWSSRPTLETSTGVSDGSDPVALVPGFAGIAETGTLMLHSGHTRPTTLNFLPDTHIVLLDAGDIVGAYEDAWDRLRQAAGAGAAIPRAVNFVTGPSRTADIEQTILMGAHGPRRLHILVRRREGSNGAE